MGTRISTRGPAVRGRSLRAIAKRCTIPPGVRIISTLAWARAAFVIAGAAACLAGCMTGAAIEPTYTQVELKAICERNGGSGYRDDLVGGFRERR
jgi:hypothetical protein